MAQRAFAGWLGRAEPRVRATARLSTDSLALLLPQGVAALLLPHLVAALTAYGAKDRLTILAAYGIGCIILADLLSRNQLVADWESASHSALKLLAEQCTVPEFLEGDALRIATAAAANLAQTFEQSSPFRDVCQMLEAATGDLKDRKTSDRGGVALRAAMARLEAMTLSAMPETLLAA